MSQIKNESLTRPRSSYPRNGCLQEASLAREAKRPRTGFRWFTSNCLLIQEHATFGCPHCGVLQQAFEELLPDFSAANDHDLETSHVDALEQGNLQVRVRCSYLQRLRMSAEETFIRIDIFAKPDPILRFSGVDIGSIVNDPLSDAWTRTIKNWLSECHSHHTECAPKEEYRLPTRLVEIKPNNNRFGLRLTQEPTPGAQYIALSHCWGNQKPIGTTKETMEQHKLSIPYDSLSKTFQDSVQTCHALGFKYIWIDSLCIAQADREDWEREAEAMGRTFGNAALVIAATASENGSQGLFREVPVQRQIHVPSQNGQSEGHVYARVALDHPDLSRGNCGMPLSGRAWCFQERMLAARILHFAEQETVWECGRKTSCECSESRDRTNLAKQLDDWPDFGVKGFHDSILEKCRADNLDDIRWSQHEEYTTPPAATDPFGVLLPPVNESFDFESYTTREQLIEYWHDVVTQYVSRDITFSGDRLPAMASAASQFASIRKLGEYASGLWTRDLLRCLVWFRDRSNYLLESQDECDPVADVPSWSWASVGGAWEYVCGKIVQIEDRYPVPSIQRDEDMINRDDDSLRISGLLKPVSVAQSVVCEYVKNQETWISHFEICEHDSDHGLIKRELPLHLDSERIYWDFILSKGFRALRCEDRVQLLYIYTQQHHMGPMRCYLVLRQNADQYTNARYERIGYFKSSSRYWIEGATWTTFKFV